MRGCRRKLRRGFAVVIAFVAGNGWFGDGGAVVGQSPHRLLNVLTNFSPFFGEIGRLRRPIRNRAMMLLFCIAVVLTSSIAPKSNTTPSILRAGRGKQ